MLIRSFVLSTVVLIAAAMPSPGQEGPVTFEFSFSNPGARSMGLGGAFAALADDATAAFANPAGLVQLLEPELSIEGRSWSYDTPFVQGGRASGEPSGLGVDTVAGFRRGVSSNEVGGLSFLSLVYPKERWSFAIYRHTWADFELESRVDGLFGIEDGELGRSEDVQARTRVEVINTGISIALELSKTFSIGLGVTHYDAVMDSLSLEYLQEDEDFFEINPFTPELLETTYSHQARSTGTALQAGFLWRPSERWSFGGYYREGPELTLRVVETTGPANDLPVGTVELDAETPLALPDVFGLGLAYRSPGGAWTVGLEWTRVLYSSITDSLDARVFDAGQIAIEDGDEVHLGVEYVFVRSRPVVGLRAGAWLDPDHSVGSGPEADLFEAAIFPGGDDELHTTGGLGLVFKHFQLDLGVDLSQRIDVASISLVYRF